MDSSSEARHQTKKAVLWQLVLGPGIVRTVAVGYCSSWAVVQGKVASHKDSVLFQDSDVPTVLPIRL